jgi:acyl carrier protein
MEQSAILRQMQEVFDKVFLTKVDLTPELSAEDVDEWDSLTHLTLLVALEKSFSIRFRTGEVENAKNVGEFADLIQRRIESK